MELINLIKEIAIQSIENLEPFEYRKGIVESISPLKIRVDQKTLLEDDELILTHLVKDYEVDISVSHKTELPPFEDIGVPALGVIPHFHEYKGKKKIIIHQGLKSGEEVILLKVQGGQNYIVLDRYKSIVAEGEWL